MQKRQHNQTIQAQQTPLKLLGTYPQKQDGFYMQRIPLFAGQLTPFQLQQLAVIAIEFTDSTPLHLTTRQDIELHNVPAEQVKTVLERLEQLELPTYGAGGDSVRNITVCPCCEFDADAYAVLPAAERIREFLHNNRLLNNMPRKFKISLAGCRNPQSKPYVNDLSFIATSRTTVRVVGAGSLGARPATGIVLYDTLPVADVLPLTAAALTLFVEHGERQNRRKARLRHIRERFGDAVFGEMLAGYFEKEKQRRDWPEFELAKGRPGREHRSTLQVVNGDLAVPDALRLAEAAAGQDARIRINLTHGIELFSPKPFELPAELAPLTGLPCIVACPGSTTCKNGLTDCPALARQLAAVLKGNETLKGKTIALSGCPNNCAHSSVADIGMSGMLKTIDGQRQEVYQILRNGGNGATDKLAEQDRLVPADAVADYLLAL